MLQKIHTLVKNVDQTIEDYVLHLAEQIDLQQKAVNPGFGTVRVAFLNQSMTDSKR